MPPDPAGLLGGPRARGAAPREEARAVAQPGGTRVGALGLARPVEEDGEGEQQRAAVARAVVNRPFLLLADEPTGNLDSSTAREIMALFDELHNAGHTLVLVTHDESVAQHADRQIRLLDGEIESDTRKHA